MEITGIVLKIKKRHTRIMMEDGAEVDLVYRKSDNYIVSHLKKGDKFRGTVKFNSCKIGDSRFVIFDLFIVHEPDPERLPEPFGKASKSGE
ncbi:hypothetical protein ASG31_17680 [Chryseobacterium sp. Leaf404]|uniref:hypothetical protein n=1 Tax=unclassified Chryseobacterium TaxID=2593645 RepID=UPI0006F1DD2F|nr:MULTISPECIES: hypothetical protein [unclassified Chryseobacterium]KQT20260.1 hypothetical protein ASG31_17680 [Chryseobacterium sp. Leaf404]